MSMHIRTVLAAVLAAVLLLPGVAPAQVGPKMGTIPGTDMTRDEFRARAQAQLAAMALNALAYRVVEGEYNRDFYDLQAHGSWVLRLRNMFTNRPVQGIMFEPGPHQLTSQPYQPTGHMDIQTAPPPPPEGPREPGTLGPITIQTPGPMRVNPEAIGDYTAGDVYYYASGDLLQLVLFAPDGTYVEWIDEVPNGAFLQFISAPEGAPAQQVYAAAVLYYVERLAPKYHNLVQFMSDQPTLPGAQLPTLPADKRVELAQRLGVIATNPYTRKEIEVAPEATRGNLLAVAAEPLAIVLDDGSARTLAELSTGNAARLQQRAQQQPQPQAQQPRQPSGRTPGAPGGGRTPGAPGGGRTQR